MASAALMAEQKNIDVADPTKAPESNTMTLTSTFVGIVGAPTRRGAASVSCCVLCVCVCVLCVPKR
jgi:hypothetical protein